MIPDVSDVVEPEVRVLEVVEPPVVLDGVGIGPAAAGAEGIEVEVEPQLRGRVGRDVPPGLVRGRPL
jgi:hypothetical protein